MVDDQDHPFRASTTHHTLFALRTPGIGARDDGIGRMYREATPQPGRTVPHPSSGAVADTRPVPGTYLA